jgi:hypothetical protein
MLTLASILGFALAVSGGLVGLGALICKLRGGNYQTTIASVLFLGGGAIVVWNGLAGGGAYGRRFDLRNAGVNPVAPLGSLSWVTVGLFVIGAGVLAAIYG